MTQASHDLPIPRTWSAATRRGFAEFVIRLSEAGVDLREGVNFDNAVPEVAAAQHVLVDLVEQGWTIREVTASEVVVTPPSSVANPSLEKLRVRRQELLKRDEQLRTESVRRFIDDMERPR